MKVVCLSLAVLLGSSTYATEIALAQENTSVKENVTESVSETPQPKVIRPFGQSTIDTSNRKNEVGGKFSRYSSFGEYPESTPGSQSAEPTKAKAQSKRASRCKSPSTRARG